MSANFFIGEEYRSLIKALYEARVETEKIFGYRADWSGPIQFNLLFDDLIKQSKKDTCFVVHDADDCPIAGYVNTNPDEESFVKSLCFYYLDYLDDNDCFGVINLKHLKNILERIKTRKVSKKYKTQFFNHFKYKLIWFLEKAIALNKPIYFYID